VKSNASAVTTTTMTIRDSSMEVPFLGWRRGRYAAQANTS